MLDLAAILDFGSHIGLQNQLSSKNFFPEKNEN